MTADRATLTDEALMAAYVAGDDAAFRALFDRTVPYLHGALRRLGLQDAEARDVIQATFLAIHRARNEFRAGARFRPWAATIATNRARELHRWRGRWRMEPHDRPGAELPDERPAQAERQLAAARVRAAIDALPETQRLVIVLHWLEGHSFGEVAQIVGSTEAAVKVRAFRGYERLRETLGADGPGKETEP